ncbi:MAG: hypothetical protein HZC06_06850 [Methylocystis sp.]|nr:hypothetical protein [Methylocystis sp.]MBI5312507.1 hypothetical protein [Methylocystis sp.]
MKAFIQRSARDDIIRQYLYFLEVESPDLADRFLLAVNQAVDKIAGAPLAGVRRGILQILRSPACVCGELMDLIRFVFIMSCETTFSQSSAFCTIEETLARFSKIKIWTSRKWSENFAIDSRRIIGAERHIGVRRQRFGAHFPYTSKFATLSAFS